MRDDWFWDLVALNESRMRWKRRAVWCAALGFVGWVLAGLLAIGVFGV